MNYNKVLTIQDISCVGQCSLTVALPILSACGQETVIMPSAVLSNHTAAGFHGFTFFDLTDELPNIQKQWQVENIQFDAIYTGYLGSIKQIGYVKNILETMGNENCQTFVDPAMADNGKLYYGFDDAYVEEMKTICFAADFILPNITEACFLTGYEYKETYDEAYIDGLLAKLHEQGAKTVVLTGVSYTPDTNGVLISANGVKEYYQHRRIPQSFHGTGDVYASAFVGASMRGHSPLGAAKIAANFVLKCMENTLGDDAHWYGVKFETAIPDLVQML